MVKSFRNTVKIHGGRSGVTDRETLRIVAAEGMTSPIPAVVERDGSVARIANRASVIIGPRRCGKTYRMFQEARALLEAGVRRESMLFVDFEDDRLFPCGAHLISDLVDEFVAANPSASSGRLYLFLDEVHNVPEWGRQIRRLLKSGRFEITVTGSSAKMLSTEIATEFKGRGISTELFPLSFREFLRFAGEESLAANPAADERAMLVRKFAEYLAVGGFPEAQIADDRVRLQMQQELVDVVITRDICQRHDLSVPGVDAFVKQALRTSGREFSVNKLYNSLRSMQVPLARDTAFALPDHCEDAYLFFLVPRLSRSYRAQRQGVRKLYAVDPGLQYAVSPASSDDEGQRFEDAVFMQLRRCASGLREGAVSTFKTASGKEVDFALGDASTEKAARLVQVSVEVSAPGTARREYAALSDALDETGLGEGTVVVFDAPRAALPDDSRIEVVSAWDWFLHA